MQRKPYNNKTTTTTMALVHSFIHSLVQLPETYELRNVVVKVSFYK
jgi:hypothetical protein